MPFVYFLQAECNGLIKIGYTLNGPMKRFKSIAYMSPVPLKLLGVIRGLRSVEADLHRDFAHLRDHGEWFQPGPELLNLIETKAIPWDADAEADEFRWAAEINASIPRPTPIGPVPVHTPTEADILARTDYVPLNDAARSVRKRSQNMIAWTRKLNIPVFLTPYGEAMATEDYPRFRDYILSRS
jgi:hypothetical protein